MIKVWIRDSVLAQAEYREFKNDFPNAGIQEMIYQTKNEVEEALLSWNIDIIVSSAKDKVTSDEIFTFAKSTSIDSRNALVSKSGKVLSELNIWTRVAVVTDNIWNIILGINDKIQVIKAKWPVLEKIAQLWIQYEALILANAALIRLWKEELATEIFSNEIMPTNSNQWKLSIKIKKDNNLVINKFEELIIDNSKWSLNNLT